MNHPVVRTFFRVCVIAATFLSILPIVSVERANAAEFAPNLDIQITPYEEGGRTAGAAPGITMLLTRNVDELPFKDAVITLPMKWPVNYRANVTRCLAEERTLLVYECSEESQMATVTAKSDYGPLGEWEFPGQGYLVNSRQYFEKNPDARDRFIGTEDDLNRQSETDLPLVVMLRLQIPGALQDFLNMTVYELPVIFYARAGDYRIEAAMLNMDWWIQTGLKELKVEFYPGPAGVMTADPDGTGTEPMTGKTVGLIRTPPTPDACSKTHTWDAKFTSWEDPNDDNTVKIATSQPQVSLYGCDGISEPYAPTLAYEPSTTQANASPSVAITMKRTAEMSTHTGLTMYLPAGIYGSPYAAPWCTPNLNVENSADVCPPETKVGEVGMVASLFDNEERLTPVIGQIFLTEPASPLDLIGVGVAIKMPSIGANQIIWLRTGMSLYGENIDGVQAVLEDMPDEFSLEKIKYSFDGTTGSQSSPPRPLLINPSHCNPGTMTVVFDGQLPSQSYTASTSVQATGCENLNYGPRASSSLSDTDVGSIPEINIDVEQNFGDAATKDTIVELASGFEINRKADISPCSSTDAANHSCTGSSQIGTVEIETPLLTEKLTGQLFLADPPEGDKNTIKELLIEVAGPAGIRASLKGKMVRSSKGTGFDIELKDLPPFPMTGMKLSVYGGSKGLIVVPSVCGPYSFNAVMKSHTGREVSQPSNIEVGGPRCAPHLTARIDPKKADAKTKLSLAVRPNTGEGYNSVRKAQFKLGKGKRKIKISTGKSKRKRSKKKSKSKKASVAKKSKKRKSKRSSTRKKVGTLKLTRTSGKATKMNVVAKGKRKIRLKIDAKKCKRSKKRKGKKRSKKKCKRLSGYSKLKISVKKGRVTLTGLPSAPIKELKLDLKSKGKFKVRNPRKKGKVTVTGTYTLANGKKYSSKAKVKISRKKKKRKRKKSKRTRK